MGKTIRSKLKQGEHESTESEHKRHDKTKNTNTGGRRRYRQTRGARDKKNTKKTGLKMNR